MYKNKGEGTIRNKPITSYLFKQISEAIEIVYGPEVVGHIYSGGQTADRRIGSVRHDDGKAADVHLYRNGELIKDMKLAKLAQYWAAKKLGGVGIEMVGGGIHIDQWSTPPKGGGMFWFYDNSTQTSINRNGSQSMVMSGINGHLPILYAKPSIWSSLIKLIGDLFNGKQK
ncbi:MAG: hypothetical protein KUG64_11310 [Cycloclasticus sp.]|nr:hypothetical protein [Cycloclasticus sp.]